MISLSGHFAINGFPGKTVKCVIDLCKSLTHCLGVCVFCWLCCCSQSQLILRFESTSLLAWITLKKSRVTFMFPDPFKQTRAQKMSRILLIFHCEYNSSASIAWVLASSLNGFPILLTASISLETMLILLPLDTPVPASICLVMLILLVSTWFIFSGVNWCTDWSLYSWISH